MTGRVLREAVQRGRLRVAAAVALMPGGLAAVRSGWVLGLSDFSREEAWARLRQQLTVVDGLPAVRRLAEPARFAAVCETAEALSAAWFAAGVRIVTATEICDERDCVRALEDRTPEVLWAGGAAVDGRWDSGAATAGAEAELEDETKSFWTRRRMAVIHSRKGRELHSDLAWVRATQAAVTGAVAGELLAGIGGCLELPAQVVRAAWVAQAMPVVDVLTGPLPVARVAWLETQGPRTRLENQPPGASSLVESASAAAETPATLTVTAVWPQEAERSTGATHAARSLRRDDLVLALAHRAVAVTVREGGNWQARLVGAARESATRRARIQVVDAVAWKLAERGGQALIAAGCDVFCAGDDRVSAVAIAALATAATETTPAHAVALPAESREVSLANFPETWPWLTHWTRRPAGAWPGESVEQWLMRVLSGGVPAAPAALDALTRIVQTRWIAGARKFLRHGPAVCLTQWPPAQLTTLARRHRGLNRPLYEPFGIGFRRTYLIGKGACAAVYGDEAVYAALGPEERFRFQFEGEPAEPWSVEGEWRVPGDLDFSDAQGEDLCLFVPDGESAARLRKALAGARIQIHLVTTPPRT